jgi:Ca2+-binding EF-hand superfamily protein
MDQTALNFKSADLVRDVFPVIEGWRKAGCDLFFSVQAFAQTFNIVSQLEQLWSVFDTDRNGRVDAHEVLMVCILLSQGRIEEKVDTIFSVFDFVGKGTKGSINFDEAIILINACVYGLQKACGDLDFVITENELNFHCRSLFDMHRLEYYERLDRQQFREWALKDPSPKYFMQLFHDSQGLPDIYSEVQEKNNEQGLVFQMLSKGKLTVTATELARSPHFRRTLENPTNQEVHTLIDLMQFRESGEVFLEIDDERYHAVLRTWNIFNVCDLDKSGALDSKEMEVLLWIQMRQRAPKELVREFVRQIDFNRDGEVSRAEWCEAIVKGEKKRLKNKEMIEEFDTALEDGIEDAQDAREEAQRKLTSMRKRGSLAMGIRATPTSPKTTKAYDWNPNVSQPLVTVGE